MKISCNKMQLEN